MVVSRATTGFWLATASLTSSDTLMNGFLGDNLDRRRVDVTALLHGE